MRPPKTITVCALALLLIQTTGCYSFRPLQGRLPSTREESREVDINIRVTKRDGETVRLDRASMDRTRIEGISHREYLEIPLTEVDALEERYLNAPRTITVIGLAITVVAVVYFSLAVVDEVDSWGR